VHVAKIVAVDNSREVDTDGGVSRHPRREHHCFYVISLEMGMCVGVDMAPLSPKGPCLL
jgi:hypothetical protein